MINYTCNECGNKFDMDFDSKTCNRCFSENISYSKESFKTYYCNDCDNVIEIPIEESKGYYNWKCEKCYSMMQCATFNIVRTENLPKRERLFTKKVRRPDIEYLKKEYGEETLNKPLESFKKKKK